VTGKGVTLKDRKPARYYVLEVLEATKNDFGDLEPRTWVVVASSTPDYATAWQAAAEFRARNPGKAYIAGELCPQFLPN
jgi:hypothetical protein